MPFEYWPIHQSEAYQQFKVDLNDFQKMKKRHEIDIQIIGSDISQRAVDTTIKNVEYAEIQQLCEGGLMSARTHGIINDPLVLAKHWPTHSISNSDSEESGITPSSGSASLANFGKSTRDVILSTYQGDFQDIGYRLAEATGNFLDFSILTNVPYGVQSKVKQR